MKVLLINGSPNPANCVYTALREVADTLNADGVETEIVQIGRKPIRGCVDCGACRKNGNRRCAFDDDIVNTVIEKAEAADGLIVGSPTYFASPNGALIALLNRMFFAAHGAFALKPAAAVLSARRGGNVTAFDVINKYFGISNMLTVGSQYWNMVFGFTPEDVRNDLEGMQTMRTLAHNMAWVLKCIEAGKQAGVRPPEREAQAVTNFMR